MENTLFKNFTLISNGKIKEGVSLLVADGRISEIADDIPAGGDTEIVDGGDIPEGAKPIVTIGFGVPYAAAQHERDDFDHPKGGRSKYLQAAVQDAADRLPEAIRKRGGEALK